MHDQEATSRVAADEYRKRSALNWEQAAAGWESEAERVRAMGAPITAWLIEHLALDPGMTVLELASGPGDVGLAVAAALSGDGRVKTPISFTSPWPGDRFTATGGVALDNAGRIVVGGYTQSGPDYRIAIARYLGG